MTPRLRLPKGISACLFDLDGVLTRTAELHAAAWKRTLDEAQRVGLSLRASADDPSANRTARVAGRCRAVSSGHSPPTSCGATPPGSVSPGSNALTVSSCVNSCSPARLQYTGQPNAS